MDGVSLRLVDKLERRLHSAYGYICTFDNASMDRSSWNEPRNVQTDLTLNAPLTSLALGVWKDAAAGHRTTHPHPTCLHPHVEAASSV